MTHRRKLLAIVCAFALALAACSGSEDSSSTAESDQAAETTETTQEATTSTSEATTSTADEDSENEPSLVGVSLSPSLESALNLTLGWMNGETIDEVSYETLFDDAFRTQVPFEQFSTIAAQLTAQGPWTLDEVVSSTDTDATSLISNEAGDNAQLLVAIVEAVDDPEDLVISTLFVGPASEAPEVATVEEAVAELEMQGTVRFLAASVDDGECTSVEGTDSNDQMPLGSIFKLYVLQAVVVGVESGELSWDQPVLIRDELDSLPSGTTQDVPAGTELSVRELAELMISISDNTATDHLIDLVGREAVEQAVVDSGHSDPQLNVPFLTTRELFVLKFTASESERADFIASSVEEKRATLDEMASWSLPSLTEVSSVTEPIEIETLEWFGSPTDVCRVLVQLRNDSEAERILALNPGVPDAEGRWTYLGYKGGSEWGVLAMAWIGTTVGGEEYVVVGGVANTDALVDDATAVALFGQARDLVADGS